MEQNAAKPRPPHPDYQGGWHWVDLVLAGVFSLLSFFIIPSLLIGLVRVFSPGLRVVDLTAIHYAAFTTIVELAIIGFIVILVRVHGMSMRAEMCWTREYSFSTPALFAAGVGLAFSAIVIGALFPPDQPPPIEALLSTPGALWVFAIFSVAFAPILEETIFRGFIFRVLDSLSGPAVAIPVSGMLFGLLHVMQLWGHWAGISMVFAIGLSLSLIRYASGSLMPAVIVHVTYNGTLVLASVLALIGQEAT